MPMLSFALTPPFLDQLLELADVPWCRAAFDEEFRRRGWAGPDDGGETAVGWLDHWPLGEPGHSWHVVLGEYPGCANSDDPRVACDEPACHEDSFIAFPLAYAAIDCVEAGTGLPIDPRHLWGDPLPAWATHQADATQDDFLARYADAERLLRVRLGTPLSAPPPVPSDEPERQTSWQRGNRLVSLFLDENGANYGQDDWIGIDIRPLH
ncbi:hypothetical protein [Streptomyces rimosus]|uniref:hypothetical protein n=1 Tax=Streptomyces rimosus TaxID=1927 RepID=UPI0004C534DA|nr:hypothetical protein [Streptomyces rimosus]